MRYDRPRLPVRAPTFRSARNVNWNCIILSPNVLVRESTVNPGSANVMMPELLLAGVEAPSTVQEVDGVAPEEMSVNAAFETRPTRCRPDDLVGTLFGDTFVIDKRSHPDRRPSPARKVPTSQLNTSDTSNARPRGLLF